MKKTVYYIYDKKVGKAVSEEKESYGLIKRWCDRLGDNERYKIISRDYEKK